MKKLLIASDSFKGSLSSIEIGEIFNNINPNTKVLSISDGGEGFVESILFNNKNAKPQKYKTFDDKKNSIEVLVAIDNKDAYIDVASIIGLNNYPNESAMKKTSYGVGYLLRQLDNQSHIQNIYIGLGGSSTSDAGFYAAIGFGYKFLDINNKEIIENKNVINTVKIISPKINSNFIGFTDVSSELIGKNGAVNLFGKQKWLSKRESNLQENYNKIFSLLNPKNIKKFGSGAAGGLGYFIYTYLKGNVKSGINKIIEISKIKEISGNFDYLITGEGRFDKQSFLGKVPIEIAKVSKTKNILVAGSIDAKENELKKYFEKWYQIINKGENVCDAIKNTHDRLIKIAKIINNY